ncbi:MAG: M1 family metallopeptidase [Acidobacteria bacterium]|nr:M1 family metallopeptidase [Acidobacteriota bacterium]
MNRPDPHSYFDITQPRTSHIHLDWFVDFERRLLDGAATLELEHPSSGPMDLDTKGLSIHSIHAQEGSEIPYELAPEEPVLGSRLRLNLPDGTKSVVISYTTSPEAIALQWLEPQMTLGKRHPFMYSQCQAIHARTVMPCQDTPRVRISYKAAVEVPEQLTAVMSAGPAGLNPGRRHSTRLHFFEMPQPIPPYLVAIAVGDLQSRDLSPRARVWSEPELIDRAAYEFAEVDSMIETAEQLFGPYDWERYDMLVLPPAFPFGGMENPRMTFLTPTVIAGDRSLVDVIAHELAHSWTGNLVTNASMEHFWLNEGFTTWAERRILDALHGGRGSALRWAIGQKALDESIARFGKESPLTKLRTELEGIDPDDAFSSIPYEKGARFVRLLEETAGRESFDRFMQKYIKTFRFTSITTEEFCAFANSELPGILEAVQAQDWLLETGMPANAPVFKSERLDQLTAAADEFATKRRPEKEQTSSWIPGELLIFLQHLPRELDRDALGWLEATFDLTAKRNYEILVEWLTIAAGSDYEPVFERIREVLLEVGRMKYLRPLYSALARHPRTRELAREIYATAKPRYHALSRRVVESTLANSSDGDISNG